MSVAIDGGKNMACLYAGMLDRMLIEYCSPTLGGLKSASLFSYPFIGAEELNTELSALNEELNRKGVSLYALGLRGGRVLIYVCRAAMLEKDLQRDGVKEFLMSYGYNEFSALSCIGTLKERIVNSAGFPHEIGLFLGYPLEDVKGYIENAGQNCLCAGNWKVYCNECETINLFMRYKKCKEIYTKLFESRGRSVYQLTVAFS